MSGSFLSISFFFCEKSCSSSSESNANLNFEYAGTASGSFDFLGVKGGVEEGDFEVSAVFSQDMSEDEITKRSERRGRV